MHKQEALEGRPELFRPLEGDPDWREFPFPAIHLYRFGGLVCRGIQSYRLGLVSLVCSLHLFFDRGEDSSRGYYQKMRSKVDANFLPSEGNRNIVGKIKVRLPVRPVC